MRIVTWIAVGAVVGLLAPTQARRLARDVATRSGRVASGPQVTTSRPTSTDTAAEKPQEGSIIAAGPPRTSGASIHPVGN